ncbi:unnamed protein product [Fraxinus pennsylvanica]|uniref:Uncharacterized protein n=1 Tax=Fraxinus pennsylvanica TaxID=56036 RepID=A0AAD2DNG1_9LAMI|nr:unnamed protein product [Fraxinus pennsylvanica]
MMLKFNGKVEDKQFIYDMLKPLVTDMYDIMVDWIKRWSIVLINNQSSLEVQDACDKTIMVAYDLIGFILDEYSKIEDIDLYQGDKSYLRNRASVPRDSEGVLSIKNK